MSSTVVERFDGVFWLVSSCFNVFECVECCVECVELFGCPGGALDPVDECGGEVAHVSYSGQSDVDVQDR